MLKRRSVQGWIESAKRRNKIKKTKEDIAADAIKELESSAFNTWQISLIRMLTENARNVATPSASKASTLTSESDRDICHV